MEYKHIPVMLDEALEYLLLKKDGYYIDCTLGGGGYALQIARGAKQGRVLGIDMDKLAIEKVEERKKEENISNIELVNNNYRNLKQIVDDNKLFKGKKFDGIVFDLGLSSAQLDDDSRGISFKVDSPLDMRFGEEREDFKNLNTEKIVNRWNFENLKKIIKEYGEERYASSIARGIVVARKNKRIKTTGELISIIEDSIPERAKHTKIHFATRTFQALRIATNDELGGLEEALPQAIDLLKKGGRCVVISYHSLEDRIVKKSFKRESVDCVCDVKELFCNCEHHAKIKIINKKVLLPSEGEVAKNPRSRSAKMRVVERI